MTKKPLEHNLDHDLLWLGLANGQASPDEQQIAARWIKGLYEKPDAYDRALHPNGLEEDHPPLPENLLSEKPEDVLSIISEACQIIWQLLDYYPEDHVPPGKLCVRAARFLIDNEFRR